MKILATSSASNPNKNAKKKVVQVAVTGKGEGVANGDSDKEEVKVGSTDCRAGDEADMVRVKGLAWFEQYAMMITVMATMTQP